MSHLGIYVLSMALCASFVLKNADSSDTHTKRNTYQSSSLPQDLPIISLKLNASIMACSHAVVLPTSRMVQLTDSQMRQMMEGMGGNYLHDYMAATPEEATENFPNMLMMVDPAQGIYASVPMSVYDNYIAKSVLMEDLNRIKFYLLNTTLENGTPDMGMYIVNTTDTSTSTDPVDLVDVDSGNSSAVKQHERPGDNIHTTEATAVPIKDKNNTEHRYTASISSPKSTSSPHTQGMNTPSPAIPTKSVPESTLPSEKSTTSTSTLNSSITSTVGQTSVSSKPAVSDASTTSVTTSTSASNTSPGLNAMVSDPLVSLSSSTIDPDVQKSLEELNKYLLGGLSQSDFSSTLREVKTTLHPDQLAQLVNTVSRRKRNVEGTTTQENYCQLKGSPTDDKQFVHICSSCAATTQLTEDFFPRYINEVVCKTGDTECFKIGNTVHGQCRQRYFTLNMLRKSKNRCMVMRHNGESLILDDWQLVPKQIRVSCECTINKLSFLKPYVSQDPTPIG